MLFVHKNDVVILSIITNLVNVFENYNIPLKIKIQVFLKLLKYIV